MSGDRTVWFPWGSCHLHVRVYFCQIALVGNVYFWRLPLILNLISGYVCLNVFLSNSNYAPTPLHAYTSNFKNFLAHSPSQWDVRHMCSDVLPWCVLYNFLWNRVAFGLARHLSASNHNGCPRSSARVIRRHKPSQRCVCMEREGSCRLSSSSEVGSGFSDVGSSRGVKVLLVLHGPAGIFTWRMWEHNFITDTEKNTVTYSMCCFVTWH